MARVALITSVYKNGDMLQPFLDDVARQTMFTDSLLILVNCSDDLHDRKACVRFAMDNLACVEHIHVKDDPGIYAAWNIGIKRAIAHKIPYITNANVDDRLHPECLERHVALLDAKQEVSVAYCQNLCTHVPNETWETTEATNRYPTGPFNPLAMLRHNLPHNHPVWRANLHEKYGFFDESLKSAADYEFWLRCVANGEKFELIPENLGLYYFNPQGISTNKENQVWKMREEAGVRRKYQKLLRGV